MKVCKKAIEIISKEFTLVSLLKHIQECQDCKISEKDFQDILAMLTRENNLLLKLLNIGVKNE